MTSFATRFALANNFDVDVVVVGNLLAAAFVGEPVHDAHGVVVVVCLATWFLGLENGCV